MLVKRSLWAALGIISMLSITQTCMGAELVSCVKIANDIQGAKISDIQGASHQSPLICHTVRGVPGVVTSLRRNGFFIQDPEPDSSPDTSEAVFVFTNSSPLVREGDFVLVNGVVQEYCYSGEDLSRTEIAADENPVPCSGIVGKIAPTVIGIRGRKPPDRIIEDDAAGEINDQNSETFDPQSDGLDFYESLEGMLVQVDDPVIVGRIHMASVKDFLILY